MKANMSTNCLLPVKSLSRNEALATACFFYEICTDIEECQMLYKALVSALSCKRHAAKVTEAFIQRHVRDKKLTPLDDSGEARNIFDFRGKLSRTYKEDSTVYDKCGSWSSDSEQAGVSGRPCQGTEHEGPCADRPRQYVRYSDFLNRIDWTNDIEHWNYLARYDVKRLLREEFQ